MTLRMIERKRKRKPSQKQLEKMKAENISLHGSPKEVFYARISREDLKLENQLDQFLTKYPEKSDIEVVTEVVEGDGDRKELYRLMNELPPGSIIHTIAIDRISRSLLDLLAMVEICVARDIQVESVRQGADIIRMNRVTMVMLGLVAEIEKANISERTKAGIQRSRRENMENPKRLDHWGIGIARYLGKKIKSPGRKSNPVYIKAIPEIRELRRMGFTNLRIAQMMTKMNGVEFSESNVSRLINHGHG